MVLKRDVEWKAVQFCNNYHYQCILPKDKSFTANLETKAAVLPIGRSSTVNSGTKVAVLLGTNRCGSFLFFSAPHSLFSNRTDLKRYEKIPGGTTWRWGEGIWLTGHSRLHRNWPQATGVKYQFHQDFWPIRDPEIPITLRANFFVKVKLSFIIIF